MTSLNNRFTANTNNGEDSYIEASGHFDDPSMAALGGNMGQM